MARMNQKYTPDTITHAAPIAPIWKPLHTPKVDWLTTITEKWCYAADAAVSLLSSRAGLHCGIRMIELHND